MAAFVSFLYEQIFGRAKPTSHRLDGRVVIVTGANTGLGLHTAIHLAKLNPKTLIMAVRNLEKGKQAKQTLLDSEDVNLDANQVQVWQLDLASLESVNEFAKRATSELDRLDLLLENAGVMRLEYEKTTDGFEQTLQVNGIATGLLGVLLLPMLVKTSKMASPSPASSSYKPHLTVVGSEVHAWSPWKGNADGSIVQHLNPEEQFNKEGGMERYQISKILSVFIAHKLAELARGSNVVVNVVNPGLVLSEFRREMSGVLPVLMDKLLARTTPDGARYILWACIEDTSDEPGAYVTCCAVKPPSPFVRSSEGKRAEDKVWEEMKGVWLDRVPQAKKSLEELSRA
ncbi:hypothetical protein OIV83_001996 [Microbotryomycetes sp. JL201]|nr:hypothetical protein OIV83_001996 [Microbotryomycetes sp. JL201]